MVQEGIQDLLVQYLQLVTGFTTADQGLLFVIIGAANLVVQVSMEGWQADQQQGGCMVLGKHAHAHMQEACVAEFCYVFLVLILLD